jgi:hypothetical protein
MVITYFGKQYVKLTLGDLTIALNPPSKTSKALPKASRFGADIALISLNHPDYNGVETVTLGDKEPFVLDSAGSYEVRELFFTGAPSSVLVEDKEYINTVFGFELDSIKIAYLGAAYDEKKFSSEAKEIAGGADLLFIAIGQDPSLAYKTATSCNPNVIIPMDYTPETLARFLKEGGQEKNESLDKATLKRRDLDGKDGFIMILAAQ